MMRSALSVVLGPVADLRLEGPFGSGGDVKALQPMLDHEGGCHGVAFFAARIP